MPDASVDPTPTPVTAPPTRVCRHIAAPRAVVYRALLDPVAVAHWKVPAGLHVELHRFEPQTGGLLRVSLTHHAPDAPGKGAPYVDTYQGRFARLVPDREVVEVDTFETGDPALQGLMTSRITLEDAPDGGTEVEAVHEGVPAAISPEASAAGWRGALDRLAEWVERDAKPGR